MAEDVDIESAEREVSQGQELKSGLMANRLSFRLRGLLTLLGERVTTAFAPYGLKSGTFTTMALVSANPGCSQIGLARVGGLDRSALVSIVDELERRKLAIRARSSVDRRRSSLYLTPQGEALMNEMFVEAMKTETSIRAGFSEDEMVQFFEFLERAYQILASEVQPED
jgi:DNA-binding MarR family transcriptional regulator